MITMTLALIAVVVVLIAAGAMRGRLDRARVIAGRAKGGSRLRRLVRVPQRPVAPSDDEVAAWCEHVARGVRAGSSLGHAVVQAGARAPAGGAAFQPVVRAIGRGRGLADAITEMGVDDPASPVGLVIPVLAACAELGGPAALPLERVAATLHARSAERAERRANSAQARLSARVLTTVPVAVLALLALAEPTVRASLTSPTGAACVVLGGLFNLIGWWWMRRIIGGAA